MTEPAPRRPGRRRGCRRGCGTALAALAAVALLLAIPPVRRAIWQPLAASGGLFGRIDSVLAVLRFHATVTTPWNEIMTDAAPLGDGLGGDLGADLVIGSRGSTVYVFEQVPGEGAREGEAGYRPRGTLELEEFIHRIHVRPTDRGPVALLAAGQLGIVALDLSDPDRPRKIANLGSEIYGYDLAVDGDRALLAGREGGFLVADVSDPRRPRLLARFSAAGHVQGAGVRGERGWASVAGVGVHTVTVREGEKPAPPRRITTVPAPSAGGAEPPPFDVVPGSDRLWVGNGWLGLGVTDLDGGPVPETDALPLPADAHVRGVSLDGDLVCAADYGGRIFLLELREGAAPVLRSTIAVEGTPVHLRCRGDRLLTTRGAQGFALFSIADRSRPVRLAAYAPPGIAHDVDVGEGWAVVARGSGGVEVHRLDGSDVPPAVARLPIRGTAQSVLVHDGRLYVSEVTGGLTVWDLADPAHPVRTQTFEIDQHVRAVAPLGDRMIAVGGEAPIAVLRAGGGREPGPDGERLVREAEFPHLGYAWRALRVGEAVYVGQLHRGLSVLRLASGSDGNGNGNGNGNGGADGADVSPVAWRELPGAGLQNPLSLAAAGELLYVGDAHGLYAFRLAGEADPVPLGELALQGAYAVRIAVAGDHLFAAAHADGLLAVELEGGVPVRVAHACPTAEPVVALAARGDDLWWAAGGGPLRRTPAAELAAGRCPALDPAP